jgi:hypothetical protein
MWSPGLSVYVFGACLLAPLILHFLFVEDKQPLRSGIAWTVFVLATLLWPLLGPVALVRRWMRR